MSFTDKIKNDKELAAGKAFNAIMTLTPRELEMLKKKAEAIMAAQKKRKTGKQD